MKATDNTLEFSKAELNALCLFASRDVTRSIHGICVDPPKGYVFSTDGHRILTWFGEPFTGAPAVFGLASFSRALRVGNAKSTYSLELGDAPSLRVEDAAFKLRVNPGPVPPIKDVYPKARAKKHAAVTLQPRVLSGVLQACQLLSGIKQCGLSFYPGATALDPVQLEFDQAKDWRALVMPMRGNAK